jgi:CRISPR/Cas system-associated exonuclease Cas4 (RecB family)
MPDHLPSISARAVASYMHCARQYFLQEIGEQEPPYRPADALRDSLQTVIYEVLANPKMSNEEMLARYDAAVAGNRVLIRHRDNKLLPNIEAMGKRLLLQYKLLELPALGEKYQIKPRIERLAQVGDLQFTLKAQPALVCGAELGVFRIVNRFYGKREILSDLEIVLSAFTANLKAGYAIVFSYIKEGMQRQSMPSFGKYIEWALICAGETIKGIQAERFPPCDPTTWYCGRGTCRYYELCGRGKNSKQAR